MENEFKNATIFSFSIEEYSMNRKILFIIMLVLVATLSPVDSTEKSVTLWFFYSSTCQHCAAEKPFLEKRTDEEAKGIRGQDIGHTW